MKKYLIILTCTTLISCNEIESTYSVNVSDIIQIGILFVALITFIFYVLRYLKQLEIERLNDELKNLTQCLNKRELCVPKFKTKQINYPKSMVMIEKLDSAEVSKKNSIFELSAMQSVYDNFYEYVKHAIDLSKVSELTLGQMIALYTIFTDNLKQRDCLDQTFQILYSCVHDTLSFYKLPRRKRKQIKRIQNSMTSKQMLYYFFNQLHYADRQRIHNQYIHELYKNDFFKTMFESDAYKSIEKHIPISVEKLFYKQSQ